MNFEELPDSVHAQELRDGVSRLQFSGALESRYLAAHLQRVRVSVRVWFSIGIVVSLVYSVVQAVRTGIFSAGFAMEFLIVVPCAAVLAWLAWSRTSYDRYYMRLAPVLVTAKGAIAAYFIAQLIGKGYDEELGMLAIYVVAAFFFAGLLFRAAVTAAAAIVVSYAATALSFGLTSTLELKGFILLLVTTVMGTIVYRDVERSHRRSFLEGALIAELVTRDGLTGLMNRRALDEQLPRLWFQAQRDRRALTVLMIDIDHFKSYNDSHGHQAGDTALRSVARIIREFTRRPLDIAARYGGEEFVVVFYDMTVQQSQETAERLRYAVQRAVSLKYRQSEVPGVTISIGGGVVEPTVGRTLEGALQFADQALYRAKNAGRNCVVFAGSAEYQGVMTGLFKTPHSAA
jgi:diguanylate cyclase (GGDEF)-like protein